MRRPGPAQASRIRRPGGRTPIGAVRACLAREDGATAVEFALVSLPFMALLIAIFETALVFFAQETLQSAVVDASRLIMTEQVQSGGLSAAQFKTQVCSHTVMINCNNLYVNVQTFSSFSSVSPLNPETNNQFVSTGMQYNTGSSGDIVLVQAFYQWPVISGPLGFSLSNIAGNNRLLTAASAFRNEPS